MEFASTSVAVVGFKEIGLQNDFKNAMRVWIHEVGISRQRGLHADLRFHWIYSCPLPSVYLKIEMIVQELSEDKWTNTDCSPH